MLRVSTHKAVPGMVLALPIFHPMRADHVLLKPGAVLEQTSLEALMALNVRELYVSYPETDFLLKYVNPALLHERAKLVASVGKCFDVVAAEMHAEFEFYTYAKAISSLVERLVENADAAIFLGDMISAADPLLSRSSTICYLSLLMGLKLDAYLITERSRIDPRRAQNVENLGLGALLHDVGMLRISAEARDRWYRTLDDADPEFQKHCSLGFDAVRGKIPATASAAVLHHHQRMDGSGFPKLVRFQGAPRSLSGQEIHIFSRIVGMADTFERLRNPPNLHHFSSISEHGSVIHKSIPTVRALKQVLEMTRMRKFDPVVFKALLACAPAYAPGSFVTLSDGRSCVVTAWEPTNPCRPTVAPVLGFDVEGGELKLGDALALALRKDLCIIAADSENTENDNFEPAYAGEFDLRMTYIPAPPCDDKEPFIGPKAIGSADLSRIA